MGLKILRKPGGPGGKNLFNKYQDNIRQNFTVNKTSGAISTGSTVCIVYPVESSTTYTIQRGLPLPSTTFQRFRVGCTVSQPATSMNARMKGELDDDTTTKSFTFTTANDEKWLIIQCTSGAVSDTEWSNYVGTIQLEKGSTATPYEPYLPFVYKAGVARRLVPAEYDMVEYIQNTTTGTYINTGINVSNSSDSFTFKFSVQQIATTAAYSWWGGQREAQRWIGTNPENGLYPSSGTNYYQSGVKVTPSSANKMLRTDIEATLTGSSSYTYNWLLFARENTNTNFSTGNKLFSFEAYKNDVLIANFIPVKKKSNSEYGLYDTVRGQFYGNAGTGSFTGGPALGNYEYKMLNKEVSAS